MKVLLVEHDSSRSQLTAASLRMLGQDVDCARSLQIAIHELTSDSFEVVLLDLALSDSKGIDTFLEVQAHSPHIPIVVFTDLNDKSLALDAVKAGAQDYVLKGVISDDSLVRCLQFAIERNRAGIDLRRGQERLRIILENSYDAFVSMDSSWRITDWNKQAEKTFGITKQQALGRSLACIIPKHLRKQYLSRIEAAFADGTVPILQTSEEIRAQHQDGREFPIEIGIFRVKEDSAYSFCAFVRDITDRQKSNEELERLVQDRTELLTRSNEELAQFAKIASHDLQEPLRAVQGFANLLAESRKGEGDSEFIEYILDGTQRMQRLISSILIHSQIKAETSSVNLATNCNSLIQEVLNDLDSSIKETGTTLEFDSLPEVAVERTQMIQLFQNLISNAIKYRGTAPPEISISAEANLNNWLFSVRDNGIGIDPQYADKVFDMFTRLHGKTAYPGTGMGLAICKKIVTSHGGTIWVESKPGEGSIFLFTLPATKKIRRSKMKNTVNILLVEDTPSDVRLAEEALKRSDLRYELVVVNDGVEALEHLTLLKESATKNLPHIILLDLNLPRKNGHDVLHEIKNDPLLKQIPVVLLTVSNNDYDVQEALRLRMNYYLAKPVSSQTLSVLIKAIQELNSHDLGSTVDHTNEETHIRQVLAGNPHTAQIALTRLSCDASDNIRCRVASNPNVSLTLLVKLATDTSPEVRLGVAENAHTPAEVLQRLAKDSDPDVRMGLSSNRHLPKAILESLARDENTHVSESAKATLVALSKVLM